MLKYLLPAACVILTGCMNHTYPGDSYYQTRPLSPTSNYSHAPTYTPLTQPSLRHPIIRRGVLSGVGAKILGHIEVGEGAKIGAGSLVLESVAPHTTVAGVPAKVIGSPVVAEPALSMDHRLNDE